MKKVSLFIFPSTFVYVYILHNTTPQTCYTISNITFVSLQFACGLFPCGGAERFWLLGAVWRLGWSTGARAEAGQTTSTQHTEPGHLHLKCKLKRWMWDVRCRILQIKCVFLCLCCLIRSWCLTKATCHLSPLLAHSDDSQPYYCWKLRPVNTVSKGWSGVTCGCFDFWMRATFDTITKRKNLFCVKKEWKKPV